MYRFQYTSSRVGMAMVALGVAFVGCTLDRSGGMIGPGETATTGGSGASSTGGTNSVTGKASSGNTPAGSCGNGIVEAGEACDDGNDAPDDGCQEDCTLGFDCDSNLAATLQLGFGPYPTITVKPGDFESRSAPGICNQESETGDVMLTIVATENGYLRITLDGAHDKLFYLLTDCNSAAAGGCHHAAAPDTATTEFAVNKDQNVHLVIEGTSDPTAAYTLDLELTGCGDGTVQKAHYEQCDDDNKADGDGCDSMCQIACPMGWTLCALTSHCYVRESIDDDWGAANSHCGAFEYGGKKGYLATLTSVNELGCAYDVTSPGSRTWIGGTDKNSEGAFYWQNGELWTWQNKTSPPWLDEGEPNNYFGEDCVEWWDDYQSRSGFNDQGCSSDRAALCEWVPPGLPPQP
jgi:cysteine-rich repeat protein